MKDKQGTYPLVYTTPATWCYQFSETVYFNMNNNKLDIKEPV